MIDKPRKVIQLKSLEKNDFPVQPVLRDKTWVFEYIFLKDYGLVRIK